MSTMRITLDIRRNGLAIDLIVSEAYSETCQTSKMELFAKRVNGWLPLTFFAKNSISDPWRDSEYALTPKIKTKTK